jgi:hypothetical protein
LQKIEIFREKSAILIGRHQGRIWYARLRHPGEGGPASVEFDWKWALAREERYGDVIGFYHTHPAGSRTPSARDLRTMRAWVSCLGKSLVCVIESGTALAAYLFGTDEDHGSPLAEIQRFPRHIIIGVDMKRET